MRASLTSEPITNKKLLASTMQSFSLSEFSSFTTLQRRNLKYFFFSKKKNNRIKHVLRKLIYFKENISNFVLKHIPANTV